MRIAKPRLPNSFFPTLGVELFDFKLLLARNSSPHPRAPNPETRVCLGFRVFKPFRAFGVFLCLLGPFAAFEFLGGLKGLQESLLTWNLGI